MAKFAKADLNKDGKVTMQEQILSALSSYGRAFLSAALALYMTGNTNPKDLLMGGIAAIAPVVLKALNPNDKSFDAISLVTGNEQALYAGGISTNWVNFTKIGNYKDWVFSGTNRVKYVSVDTG